MVRMGHYAKQSKLTAVVHAVATNNMSQVAAAKQLGMTKQNVSKHLKKKEAQLMLADINAGALRRAGATLSKIYSRINDALDATVSASFKGEVMSSDVPDARVRLDAAIEALELTGRKKTAANQDDITKPTEIHIHYGHRVKPGISTIRQE